MTVMACRNIRQSEATAESYLTSELSCQECSQKRARQLNSDQGIPLCLSHCDERTAGKLYGSCTTRKNSRSKTIPAEKRRFEITARFVTSFSLRFLTLKSAVTFVLIIIALLDGRGVIAQDRLDGGGSKKLGLYPSVVNLAAQANINVNATCGETGAEDYCRLVEHMYRLSRRRRKRSQCDTCFPGSHEIEFAIDGRGDRWWQSPSISNGYEYHWVTITLDLKQVFQVAYVILKAANSPRPGNWILEKSLDGVNWKPWQYFAVTTSDCRRLYPARTSSIGSTKLRFDSEVVCTSFFSQILPLRNGEIHISLINGRPTAENPSAELIEFTSARYIRFRFQKIRTLYGDLMTIANNPADQVDPSVTRRYFYSVKDISIGGMCICYGHAHDCPSSPLSGRFVCKCEHNTAGDNCEQCLPKFNQHQWSPGNGGFQCEECNCHGHADSCYYDANVERRKESVNMQGIRKGGGVCIGCRDNTEGVNCESCVDGFFRPINFRPSNAFPCMPCQCDSFGSMTNVDGRRMCRKSTADGGSVRGMMPGDCYCKDGYAGSKCDRCDFGFRGYPNCEPCPCNAAGSLNVDPCAGACICKAHVTGVKCDQCERGHFNLDRTSSTGCEECFCSGVTDSCESAPLFRNKVSNMRGWEIQNRPGSHGAVPQYDVDLDEPVAQHGEMSHEVCTGLYYWSAPEDYLGNKLTSYGGNLRYTIFYELPTLDVDSATLISGVDVIMEGSGISLEYSRGGEVQPYVATSFLVPLETGVGWVESNTGLAATKPQILQVLSDLRRLLIRASYNQNADSIFRIRDVGMDIATTDGPGEPVSSVERCFCPRGYTGNSCENCAQGYYRSGRSCVECNCNGHTDRCNLYTGVCEDCQDNTMGIHCERCSNGYYGDATKGTPADCTRCACPLPTASNNFSPTCVFDELDKAIRCLQCPVGYEGHQCQRCADGYFGNPTRIGEVCQRCQCNGNSQTCDKSTGNCIACRDFSAGPNCEQCAAGYYGDAVRRKDCRPCLCDVNGSVRGECDPFTGQCTCRPGVSGRQCDRCPAGKYLDATSKACILCDCHTQGSTSTTCSSIGHCFCKPGVAGAKCDQCNIGYYNFGPDGCEACSCPHTNNHCNPDSGACVCPPNTEGPRCTVCTPNSYGWTADKGCQNCRCDTTGSKSSQCDAFSGSCDCKDEFEGEKCNRCRAGFYDFPDCLPCACFQPGTESSSCSAESGDCSCTNFGQCQCKVNVVGAKCQRCAEGAFSLQIDNPKGCTECFCFGVTDECSQAEYHWGSTISLRTNMQVMVANQINTRSTSEGVVMSKNTGLVTMDTATVRRSLRYEPYYWRLPPQFNGDKLTSYGGHLQFTIYYAAQIASSNDGEENVVIRGRHNATTIAYRVDDPPNKQSKIYTLTMREDGWKYLGTDQPVSRYDFAMVLSDIDFFLIKASYGHRMDQSRLSDVFLDVAVEGSGGRGDSTSSGPPALGVEECVCPPGYTGLSCQNCATGYMRIGSGPQRGKCKPCACNGKSEICDVNTGVCVGCRGNFIGDRCDRCAPGYYLTSGPQGPACRKCACPLPALENNFSPTCRATGSDGVNGYICDRCPVGYEGVHCERCSPGYFGNPNIPGSSCMKCGCNPAGSFRATCDRITGKCLCKPGITGRVCDQCRPRHVITENGCIACDDECSGLLLDDVETLITRTRSVDLENLFPPPWDELLLAENATNELVPYLKILVHRKRNFDAARCLHFKEKLDETMTNNMDTMMLIVKVTPEMNKMNQTLNHFLKKSQMCYLDGDDLSYVVNRTQKKVTKQLDKAKNAVKETKGLATRLNRLLDRLQDGTIVDDDAIASGIIDLIDQLRNRDLAPYQKIADEELRLANELLSRVKNKFLDPADDVTARYNETKHTVDSRLTELQRKLEDLLQKVLAARTQVQQTLKMNNMNNVTIRQLKSDIDKLQNEIAMVEMVLDEAKKIMNDTEYQIEDARTVITNMKLTVDKLREMTERELKPESDRVIANLAKLEALRMLVNSAEDAAAELMELSKYFQEVYNNVSGISVNQTDAATRYVRIAGAMTKANETANEAMALSMEALNLAKGNLSVSAEDALRGAMALLDEVNAMKETVKNDKQRLRALRNQNRTVNSRVNDLIKDLKKTKKRVSNLETDLFPDPNDIKKIARESMAISDEVLEGLADLERKKDDLQSAVDTAIQYSETMNEIRNNRFWVDSVPDLLSQANAAIDETRAKRMRVEVKSDAVRRRIDDVRKQIEESRKKAASVRKASVKSEGQCTMRYQPKISPSRVTDIVLQVIVDVPHNTLFYLGRDDEDHILIKTIGGRVSVTWDLGSGSTTIQNQVSVVRNQSLEEDWYRVEIHREDKTMNLTVFQIANMEDTIQTETGSSPGGSTILNVDEGDWMYIGGLGPYVKMATGTRSFTGCMGEAFLQRQMIGLWNFDEVSDPSLCEGCFASPLSATKGQAVVYNYDGNSYTVLQQLMSRSSSHINVIDFYFNTFSSNGLLMYKGSNTSNDFASVELEDGKLVARVDLGSGMYILRSDKRYNVGKWVKAYFRRLNGKVQLMVMSPDSESEIQKIRINGSDGHLNTTSSDITCVGGCPPNVILTAPIQKLGFVGCIKQMEIYGQPQQLSGSGTNVIRDSGVGMQCPDKIFHNIGIDDHGFVQLPGYDLRDKGSVSITFNTREPDTILLLAINDGTSRRRRRRQSEKNFYSLSISGGYVEARLRGPSGSALVLRSRRNTYSDGDEHVVILKRRNARVLLDLDDDTDSVTDNFDDGDGLTIVTTQLYVGGVPYAFPIKDMVASDTSLNGCIREFVTDRLVDFREATLVNNSFVGSCVFSDVVVSYPSTTTRATRSTTTTTMVPMTTQPVPMISTTAFPGCASEGDLAVMPSPNVHFGRGIHSHMQFAFGKKIENKFRIEIEFRTLASRGLLLYATHDEHNDFFSLQLDNGKPVFRFDSGKGVGHTVGNFSINDGQWHTVRIARSKRKGSMKVDTMRYQTVKSPKGANRMDVVPVLHVGGVPSTVAPARLVGQLAGVWQSLDSCVRSVSLFQHKFDLRKPDASNKIGSCYSSIEKGTYFDGSGYAIYDANHRVGPGMSIELDFRTWANEGVFISVSDNARGDGLALEMVNGSVYFRVNNGGGNMESVYTPKTELPGVVALCDGKWHKIKATKTNNILTLLVDGQVGTAQREPPDENSADTKDPLYIGGIPDDAQVQRQLTTDRRFMGCMKNVKLKGQVVDFSKIHSYQNIYPNSCPRAKG